MREAMMLSAIVKKEIRGHVLSFRFVVTFALLLVIVPVTVLVLTNDDIRKQDDYSRRQAEIEDYLGRYAHFNRLWNVVKPSQPPLPFYAAVRGLSAETGLDVFVDDPLPIMFPLIDLIFIVTILLSLTGLIYSYDAVSGEKEDGTLKLMLANDIPRSKIIIGKILGSVTTLLIPFAAAMTVGLFIILLNPRVGWKGADWGALGLILLAAVIYIGLFACLGILISSRHSSSSSSIFTSLVVWVLLVLAIPNISPYIASFVRPAPSAIKVGREIFRLTQDERDVLGRKLEKEKRAEVLKAHPVLNSLDGMSEAEIQAAVRNDPAFGRAFAILDREKEAAWQEANAVQGAKAKLLRNDLEKKQRAQVELSTVLSMLSPLADFTYLATDLSNTGIRNRNHFERLREAWDRSFEEYSDKRMAALEKANPAMDVWNTAVDVSDMPRFKYREESLAPRLEGVLPAFAVLLVAGLAVFGAAYVSFIRYDPR
jgi:ABC-type transport system involved in multi-copper enzyme maturation permease subunit